MHITLLHSVIQGEEVVIRVFCWVRQRELMLITLGYQGSLYTVLLHGKTKKGNKRGCDIRESFY